MGLLAGSWPRTVPLLLGLGIWYSPGVGPPPEEEDGDSMACSLSAGPPSSSSCRGSDWGKPNISRAEKKSKAPHSRKPAHQAPIQRGSSGEMPSLPVEEEEEEEGTANNDCDDLKCKSKMITHLAVFWYGVFSFNSVLILSVVITLTQKHKSKGIKLCSDTDDINQLL